MAYNIPPAPNKPIEGTVGELEFLEEGSILETKGTKLVDNAWAAPGANGCGGLFSLILDPIVNAAAGLPAAAGKNTAILVNKVFIAAALAVKNNNDRKPLKKVNCFCAPGIRVPVRNHV